MLGEAKHSQVHNDINGMFFTAAANICIYDMVCGHYSEGKIPHQLVNGLSYWNRIVYIVMPQSCQRVHLAIWNLTRCDSPLASTSAKSTPVAGRIFSTKVRLVDREGSGSLGIILRNVADKEIVMIEQLTGREWLVAGTKSMNLPTRICKYYPIITIMVASCPQIWIAGLKSGFHSQDCRCHSQTLGFSVLGLIDWGVYDWKLLDLHIV